MIFEVLASEDAATQERLSGTRAVIAAQTRAKDAFGTFVANAETDEEREARISLVASDLDTLLADVAKEYGYDNIDQLRNAATVALGGGHASDCTCGFCENKGSFGKGDDEESTDDGDSDSETKESSVKTACSCCDDCKDGDCDCSCSDCSEHHSKTSKVDVRQTTASAAEFPWEHVAADVEDGDTFAQERVDLPSSKDGLGGPSPKIDKGPSGTNEGWTLKPIDVPSNQHPEETQDIHDKPNYEADLPGVSETGKSVSADSPLQPEHNTGDHTDTWTGTEGLADPVTSAVLAKWSVA